MRDLVRVVSKTYRPCCVKNSRKDTTQGVYRCVMAAADISVEKTIASSFAALFPTSHASKGSQASERSDSSGAQGGHQMHNKVQYDGRPDSPSAERIASAFSSLFPSTATSPDADGTASIPESGPLIMFEVFSLEDVLPAGQLEVESSNTMPPSINSPISVSSLPHLPEFAFPVEGTLASSFEFTPRSSASRIEFTSRSGTTPRSEEKSIFLPSTCFCNTDGSFSSNNLSLCDTIPYSTSVSPCLPSVAINDPDWGPCVKVSQQSTQEVTMNLPPQKTSPRVRYKSFPASSLSSPRMQARHHALVVSIQ